MSEPRQDPEKLAGRVADGEPVDWDGALLGASDDKERGIIRHLRLVESVARAHSSASMSGTLARQECPTIASTSMGAPRRDLAPASGIWGHLEIRGKLGEGGFGEVYRAWDRRLDREVALKLLKSESSIVVNEGRMLARLRHPNVVTVHGAEIHDGLVGIWMEFIKGRSLEQLLQEQGPFGAREASLIGIDLCRALAAVHGAGLVHRDVKGQNAMREEGGRILLTDFGAGIEASAEHRQSQASISGTPLYMAPELFRGGPATPKSDIYSLGVLLYRIVTSAFPIQARSWDELRDKHARREAVLLRDRRSDLPEAFVTAIERALGWDPQERFGTAGQMEQALSLALGAASAPGTGSASAEAPALPAGPPRRRTALIGGGAVVLAAAAVIAWFLVAPGLPERQSEPDRPLFPAPPPATAPGIPPPAPAADVAPGTYTVEAALYRVAEGSTRRDRLEAGARLALGDHLTLEFRASTSLHVYVINEDEANHAYALFPLPGLEPRNPLAPGATHRLPGSRDGSELSWIVDSPGGREHLMVVASPARLVEFESEMNALARPGQMAVQIPDGTKVRLRGIGGLDAAPASPAGGSAGRLFEMADRLTSRAEVASGVWMRRIELENPPPR